MKKLISVLMLSLLMVLAIGMVSTAYAASGQYTDSHGNVIYWTLNPGQDLLKVYVASGTPSEDGAICDFDQGKEPWHYYKDKIKVVWLTNIKWLGGSTFRGYPNLETVVIDGSEMEMTDLFFADCKALSEVEFKNEKDESQIGENMYILKAYYDPDDEEGVDPYKDYDDDEYGPFSGCDADKLNIIAPFGSTAANNAGYLGLKVNGKWRIGSRSTHIGSMDDYNGPIVDEDIFYFTSLKWTGGSLKPVPDVWVNGKALEYGTDYEVTWKKNKNVGEAQAHVKGIGDYWDTDFRLFKIYPKGTSIKRVTSPKKKQLKVTWLKQDKKMSSSRIDYYYIQIATNKSFTKNKKTAKVKGYKNISKTFKNLKSGKRYYVRVRTSKYVNYDTFSSTWSPKKSVKVR